MEDFITTILTIIFFLLPVIFGGKKRRKVNRTPRNEAPAPIFQEESIEDYLKRIGGDPVKGPTLYEAEENMTWEIESEVEEEVSEIIEKEKPAPQPVISSEEISDKELENKGGNRKKIDPKDMIIYSEILKPKYQE